MLIKQCTKCNKLFQGGGNRDKDICPSCEQNEIMNGKVSENFEAALESVNKRYGNALKRLADE